MSSSDKVRRAFKEIPSVDAILEYFKDELNSAPYILYINTIRSVLDAIRTEIKDGIQIADISNHTYTQVSSAIESISSINLCQVINGTGIILHTGLGRAPLSKKLVDRAIKQILHYSIMGQNHTCWNEPHVERLPTLRLSTMGQNNGEHFGTIR